MPYIVVTNYTIYFGGEQFKSNESSQFGFKTDPKRQQIQLKLNLSLKT